MEQAILLLGGNLGEREQLLEKARKLIAEKAGAIIATSSLYESEPWGFEHENLFLNQALKINTELSPQQLIEALLEIEQTLGRIRTGTVSARVIDIDILFYGSENIKTATLTIPHPRIHERLFTLLPLQEITGNEILPVINKAAAQLISECTDRSNIQLYPQK